MTINTKNLAGLGFTSNSRFADDRTSLTLHHRQIATKVLIIDGVSPEPRCWVLRLTANEAKQYKAGKLSIVPPGFCAPTAGNRIVKEDGFELLHDGPIKSKVHVRKIFKEFNL
jgi:hypothetical protein